MRNDIRKTNMDSARFILQSALLVGVVGACASLSGCLSDDEKKARAACALDVSGDYDEVRPAGTTAGKLVVTNESDKTDVQLAFTRGAIYDGEQAFIDRLKNDADKTAVTASLTLGTGDDKIARGLAGGQNISDDFGASSKVSVAGSALEALPSVDGATDASMTYSLDVVIDNGSDEMKGTLHVTFTEKRPQATSDDEELHSESKDFAVIFKRAGGVLEQEQSAECKDIVDGSN